MSAYAHIIQKIDATVNAAGVECSMRLQYGTLDHLPLSTFHDEIKLYRDYCAEDPNFERQLLASYGMNP